MKPVLTILFVFVSGLSRGQTRPIQTFLASPIKDVAIYSGVSGCFHYAADTIKYEADKNSVLVLKNLVLSNDPLQNMRKFYVFRQPKPSLQARSLLTILSSINSNPGAFPS